MGNLKHDSVKVNKKIYKRRMNCSRKGGEAAILFLTVVSALYKLYPCWYNYIIVERRYLLYVKLKNEGIKPVHINLYATTNEVDAEGYPLRFIEYKGTRIAYDIHSRDMDRYLVKKEMRLSPIVRMKSLQ